MVRRSVYFQMGLFCCASRCQMPDPTALNQGLQLVFVFMVYYSCYACSADDAASRRSQATEGTLKSASQGPDTT